MPVIAQQELAISFSVGKGKSAYHGTSRKGELMVTCPLASVGASFLDGRRLGGEADACKANTMIAILVSKSMFMNGVSVGGVKLGVLLSEQKLVRQWRGVGGVFIVEI
jgi:hypothetical protein